MSEDNINNSVLQLTADVMLLQQVVARLAIDAFPNDELSTILRKLGLELIHEELVSNAADSSLHFREIARIKLKETIKELLEG